MSMGPPVVAGGGPPDSESPPPARDGGPIRLIGNEPARVKAACALIPSRRGEESRRAPFDTGRQSSPVADPPGC